MGRHAPKIMTTYGIVENVKGGEVNITAPECRFKR
jgi:hypothetical protein